MSETCIVCLGDLGENAALQTHLSPHRLKSPPADVLANASSASPTALEAQTPNLIAHLLPCGHNLHDECLKPWVERANSCPICRQSFNQVELFHHLEEPSISSYAVNDRTQVADVDPSMIVDELYDEPEDRPCPICQDDDNEEVLLSCDSCNAYYHTYCLGLDGIPVGHWFCETCETQRAIESVNPASAERPPPRAHHTADRRTRAQQRRIWNQNQASSSSWARVWQSVWDHLNFDLDFPFDEDTAVSTSSRTLRPHSVSPSLQWQLRNNVADGLPGENRFGDTAPVLLHSRPRRAPSQQPEPESQEEIRAWNALEKAKEIEANPLPKRKRKSATTSPSEAEPPTQHERPLKRPRTKRVAEPDGMVSGSGSRRSSEAGPSSARSASTTTTPNNGPSLLQSMLRKIETSNPPDDQTRHTPARLTLNPAGMQVPTQTSSSAASSPSASNHASPRARSLTPPPSTSPRPGSPLSLTSTVEPIFPPVQFSPERSPTIHHPQPHHLQTHDQSSSPPRTNGSPTQPLISPTKSDVSFSIKSDLQKMVSSALKPHWHSNQVTKDQYTDINRQVSRLLYDRAGEQGYAGSSQKETYERYAFDEVSKAVEGLKAVS